MNKFAFFFVAAIVIALAAAKTDREKFRSAHDECQTDEKTKVREDYMELKRKDETVDEPNDAAHTICMATKLGLLDANGKAVKDKVKSKLTHLIKDEAKLAEALEKCCVDKDTPEQTARLIFSCLYKAGISHHNHD